MQRQLLLSLTLCAFAAPATAWELAICANPDGAPYSTEDLTGFDNRIVEILADELQAAPRFVWMPDHRLKTAIGFLHRGDCDVIMGVLDGQSGMLTSHAYYRTGFVFVTRPGGPEIASLDDASLASLRIGVAGGARRTTPPGVALARRGLLSQIRHFGFAAEAAQAESRMLDALAEGEIDVAILWGPMGAAFDDGGFVFRRVLPEIDIPFLPMVASLSVGLRPEDVALRDALDLALAARWEDVQAVLVDAGVPLLDLPRPVFGLEAGQ